MKHFLCFFQLHHLWCWWSQKGLGRGPLCREGTVPWRLTCSCLYASEWESKCPKPGLRPQSCAPWPSLHPAQKPGADQLHAVLWHFCFINHTCPAETKKSQQKKSNILLLTYSKDKIRKRLASLRFNSFTYSIPQETLGLCWLQTLMVPLIPRYVTVPSYLTLHHDTSLVNGDISEKCTVRWFYRCANITESIYTNLDGTGWSLEATKSHGNLVCLQLLPAKDSKHRASQWSKRITL